MELGQVLLGNNDDYNYTPKKKLPLPTSKRIIIFETIIFLSEKSFHSLRVLVKLRASLGASLLLVRGHCNVVGLWGKQQQQQQQQEEEEEGEEETI